MKKKLLMTASTYGHIRCFHLPYLQAFQRLGWETHVGCAGIPESVPFADSAINLPFVKSIQPSANIRAARILREKIRAEQYDLIITHTALAAFFTRFAVKGLPSRPRLIDVVHGYLFDDDTPAPRRGILLTAERITAGETDLLLTMNGWDTAAARKYRLGKQIDFIPGMGVDFAKLDEATAADGDRLRRELGLTENQFVVICAAEFSERKSQRTLIEAAAKLPRGIVLILCGTGTTLDDCKLLAKRLKVDDRVHFPGQVDNMPVWYRMADAAVSASRSEGLPFNVMEAMHLALPVAASAVKGHTDLIDDGESGLLFPYGNADACAEQIGRLAEDAALREQIGAQAKLQTEKYGLSSVLPEVMRRFVS